MASNTRTFDSSMATKRKAASKVAPPPQFAFGFKNAAGEVVIDARYEGVGAFNEGFAPVRMGGKWGLVDERGTLVVPPTFDLLTEVYLGLAAFRDEQQKWGVVDTSGKIVLAATFERSRDIGTAPGFEAFAAARESGTSSRAASALTSFRVDNPAFEEFQAAIELGARFYAKLEKYEKGYLAALEADDAAIAKMMASLAKRTLPEGTTYLEIEIYDFQDDWSVVATPMRVHPARGTEQHIELLDFEGGDDDSFEPLKKLSRFQVKSAIAQPTVKKGIDEINACYAKCFGHVLARFAEHWQRAGGAARGVPAYAHGEDTNVGWIDLATGKETDAWAASGRPRPV